jgi:hypothetical protein
VFIITLHAFLAKDESARTGLSSADVAAVVAFREKALKERVRGDPVEEAPGEDSDEGEESRVDERTPFLKSRRESSKAVPTAVVETTKRPTLSIDPLAPASAFDERLRDRLRENVKLKRAQLDAIEDEEDEEQIGPSARATRDAERLLERNFHAPAGKKIAVPVRIEPKVYFATERTFLVSVAVPSNQYRSSPPLFPVICSPMLCPSGTEMAALCDLHRDDRDDAAQLCVSG